MANYREEAPQVIKDFLRYLKTNMDHSDKTIQEYFLDLRTFFRFMKMERGAIPADSLFENIGIKDISLDFIKEITKIDINNYIDYLRSDRIINEGQQRETVGLASNSTHRKISCLKSFFSYLCEGLNVLDKNPTIGIITPLLRPKLPVYLTEDESRKLLQAVSGLNADRDYCMLLLFLSCGMRVSEIVGMNLTDLRTDNDDAFLTIMGKGGKERQVFLSDACMEAIHSYIAVRDKEHVTDSDADALFLSRKHNRISVDAVQGVVAKATKAAGLRHYSPHKLRHTAATLMLQNGVDVRTIQEVLGHANLNTTQIYTHVNSDALRVASKANPLSRGIKKRRTKDE